MSRNKVKNNKLSYEENTLFTVNRIVEEPYFYRSIFFLKLGEVLRGDRIVNTAYKVRFLFYL